MPLSSTKALELAEVLMNIRQSEKPRLDTIYEYLRDDPEQRRLQGLPEGVPSDVQRLARIARVNLLKYIVSARVQSMYIDGFQTPTGDNVEAWKIWQRNRMDMRQIGINRAALSYGASYSVTLPGEPVPVIKGASPRQLTVAYSQDDDDWPVAALWKRRNNRWRLLDKEAVYELRGGDVDALEYVSTSLHKATDEGEPVCPVVRFRDTDDLDDPVRGIVEPFIPLQDQINVTTFGLLVAQHYGAFRQRYILGWLAESEQQLAKMGADKMMSFEDPETKVGEFGQTDLRGYIESREASVRHLATVSQTPVHELMGQFVNLSAEALEAARASHQAAIDENRMVAGESYEATLNLAGQMDGDKPDPEASVVWRDTRVRSLSEAADALGKLANELGVPRRSLWSRVPGVAQQELRQWEKRADAEDEISRAVSTLAGATQ